MALTVGSAVKHKDHEKGNLKMQERKLQPISAFEWASVAQYVVYISGAAGLKEVNSDHVLCLPLARIGPEKLLSRKMRVALVLKSNLRSLEGFVGRFEAELEVNEISVIRGMYRQFRDNLETVSGHMEIIEDKARTEYTSFYDQGEEKDDTPF